MTLKEILENLDDYCYLDNNDKPHIGTKKLEQDLRYLIRLVYDSGAVDRAMADQKQSPVCMSDIWQKNKHKFLGND